MPYHLNETELNQIRSWYSVISDYYSESDAAQLRTIIQKSSSTGLLEENDIYALLEILPRIVPKPHEKLQKQEEKESAGWQLYMDEQQARYKREMDKLRQSLSNWTFMMQVVHYRNLKPLKNPLGLASAKVNHQEKNRIDERRAL